MRFLPFILLSMAALPRTQAQLPSGSVAPDFSIAAVNGKTYELYKLLDQGKIVILAFVATSSPNAWAYHSGRALHDLYTQHGPKGDNKAEVIMIEGDPATNVACLSGPSGCNNISPGNWLKDTEFPIVDHAATAAAYNIKYYPTIYAICPNRKVYETGALNPDALWEKASECPVAFGQNNGGLFYYETGLDVREICGTQTISPAFSLVNLGSQALTNATIDLKWNDQILQSIQWSGNLSLYGETPLTFNKFSVTNQGKLTASLTLTKSDEDKSNNTRITNYALAPTFTTSKIVLKVKTDEYGAETYWELRDQMGKVVQSGGNTAVGPSGGGKYPNNISSGPGAYGSTSVITDTIYPPGNGCYTLHFVDAYGDGMCCSFGNGYYRLYNALPSATTPVMSGGEFELYDRRALKVAVPPVGAEELVPTVSPGSLRVYPSPAASEATASFYMQRSARVSVSVFDALGRITHAGPPVFVESGAQSHTFPVAHLPEGVYILRLTPEEGREQTFRFVVQR